MICRLNGSFFFPIFITFSFLAFFSFVFKFSFLFYREYLHNPKVRPAPAGKFSKSILFADIPLWVHEIIIGLALGDLHIRREAKSANSRLCFEGSIKHATYIQHLYSIFVDFCNTEPVVKLRATSHNIAFTTLAYSVFNYYRDLFYVDGIKIVPLNIGDLLSPRGLAYWFMDDGYFLGNGYGFCTDSYTLAEVQLLVNVP